LTKFVMLFPHALPTTHAGTVSAVPKEEYDAVTVEYGLAQCATHCSAVSSDWSELPHRVIANPTMAWLLDAHVMVPRWNSRRMLTSVKPAHATDVSHPPRTVWMLLVS
jgi:hypothetical protein